MLLLLLGLVLFLGTHSLGILKSTKGALVARLGEGGYKLAYTALSAVGFALIIYGYGAYRTAGYIPVWDPPRWFGHVSLLLMLPLFVLLASVYLPGEIKRRAKHPMLLAVKVWALAHLLANGDLGSMLLFAAFLAWAVVDRIALKRRGDMGGGVLAAGWVRNDWVALGFGLAVYVAFVLWLHPLLIGVAVLPGR